MNSPLTFEAETFELPETARDKTNCSCPHCRAARQNRSDEVSFEELSLEQVEGVPVSPVGTVRFGSVGEKTCWVQNVLNQAEGESLKTDAIFGPLTRAAVQRFQTSRRLLVDGIVGPQTETALIQTGLNAIARASLLAVDGVRGPRTQQEIRKFQAQRRVVVDGIVGPITRGEMIDALGGRRCPARAVRPPVPPPRPRPPVPPPPPPPPPPPQPPRPPIVKTCPIAGRGNTIDSVHPKFVPIRGIGVNGTFRTNASASILGGTAEACELFVDASITTAIASQVSAFGSFVAIVNGNRLKSVPLVIRRPSIQPPTLRPVGEGTIVLPPGDVRSLQVEVTTGYRLRAPEGLRIESATDTVTLL